MRTAVEVAVFWPWILLGAALRRSLPSEEAFRAIPQVARGIAFGNGEGE